MASKCNADIRVSSLATDSAAVQRDIFLRIGQVVVSTPGQVAQVRSACMPSLKRQQPDLAPNVESRWRCCTVVLQPALWRLHGCQLPCTHQPSLGCSIDVLLFLQHQKEVLYSRPAASLVALAWLPAPYEFLVIYAEETEGHHPCSQVRADACK